MAHAPPSAHYQKVKSLIKYDSSHSIDAAVVKWEPIDAEEEHHPFLLLRERCSAKTVCVVEEKHAETVPLHGHVELDAGANITQNCTFECRTCNKCLHYCRFRMTRKTIRSWVSDL